MCCIASVVTCKYTTYHSSSQFNVYLLILCADIKKKIAHFLTRINMFNGASKFPINNALVHSVYARYITCDLNLIRDFMPGKWQYNVSKCSISKFLSRTKM